MLSRLAKSLQFERRTKKGNGRIGSWHCWSNGSGGVMGVVIRSAKEPPGRRDRLPLTPSLSGLGLSLGVSIHGVSTASAHQMEELLEV